MTPLALLPVLVVACMGAPAPGGLLAATNPLVHHHHPVATYAAAPAIVHHQLPLTQTIHYETKPVVTGYQTTILKPALATHTIATPVLAQPAIVAPAPAPVVVAEQRPVPIAPAVVQEPAPIPQEVVEAAPVQADSDTAVIENPEFRSAGAPAQPLPAGPAHSTFVAASPGAYAAYAPVQHAPALVYSPQAPHFDHLVTRERVLAPVRTHTQITPQLTQIQPEVTVRKVIHDVPVAQPVAYTHTQYVQQPAITYL